MQKGIRGLLLLHFLNDGIRTTFVTLLPFISKELSLSLSMVGFLGSVQPLIASILALPAGFVASRIGGFHSLIFLLIIYSLGAFLASVSPTAYVVTAAFLLAALGFGMFHTVSFALIAKFSDKTNMGKNMGTFISIGDIGRLIIPPAAVFLVPFLGWRMVMTGIALIGLATFLFLRFFIPKKDPHQIDKPLEETHLDFLKSILKLLKVKRFILILLAAIFDSLAAGPVYLFLPFLLFSKGILITQYGIIAAIYLLGSLSGKNILGRLVDKKGNLIVFIISEVLMALSLVLLTLTSNFILIILISFILGLFTKGTSPVIQAMVSEVSHSAHYHKIFAISETAIASASVITVIIMGFIADQMGVTVVYYSAALLALLAILPALLLRKS